MLIELRFYYKDGNIAHRLIQCNDPTKWEGKSVLTNVAKMVEAFSTILLKLKFKLNLHKFSKVHQSIGLM